MKEAEIMAKLDHKHIVRLIGKFLLLFVFQGNLKLQGSVDIEFLILCVTHSHYNQVTVHYLLVNTRST